jgi:hypothetical protein
MGRTGVRTRSRCSRHRSIANGSRWTTAPAPARSTTRSSIRSTRPRSARSSTRRPVRRARTTRSEGWSTRTRPRCPARWRRSPATPRAPSSAGTPSSGICTTHARRRITCGSPLGMSFRASARASSSPTTTARSLRAAATCPACSPQWRSTRAATCTSPGSTARRTTSTTRSRLTAASRGRQQSR